MHIFQGSQFAKEREALLVPRVRELSQQGKLLKITAILFHEDKGSQLYTRLKKQAAERIGIEYAVETFSMLDPMEGILEKLDLLNADATVTGIIIQKPAKTVWREVTGGSADEFQLWWHQIVNEIDEKKDVDGLHPKTLEHFKSGDWQKAGCVMPATAKASLTILEEAKTLLREKFPRHPKIIVLGKSDILGQPLYYEFKNRGEDVEMIGSKELAERVENGVGLQDADVIISATGRPNLVTGELIKVGSIIIDVGEPKPDVEAASVQAKAAFLTPVPGGVGPVTIVSLLENAVELGQIS
jgi:methylenetetrahydrofolate dehydrogenase (NADP+) / methenyltetrahydrofolate cyclohydrolase